MDQLECFCNVVMQMCRSVFTTRNDSPMAKVNCVRWLPMSGQGLVIGTNQGHVIINHSVSSNTSTLNDALRWGCPTRKWLEKRDFQLKY